MPKTFTQWLSIRLNEDDVAADFDRKAADAALKAAKNPMASGSEEIKKTAEEEIRRIVNGPKAGTPQAAQQIAQISQTIDKTQNKPTAAQKVQQPDNNLPKPTK